MLNVKIYKCFCITRDTQCIRWTYFFIVLSNHNYCKMQKFCPLCMKNGIRSRIKAFQISLEEAVWSCERMNCIWPFSYQNPIFIQRSAMTCNWDDSYVNEESTPTLSELSLYTPPMTPREEVLEYSANSTTEDKSSQSSSKRESIDYDKPLSDVANNRFTKERDVSRHINKQMPEVTNVEKVNIDISKFLQHKHFNNERMQEHSCATSVVNTGVNSSAPFADTECNNLYTRYEIGGQSESDNVQVNKIATCLERNTNVNRLSTTTNSKVNMDIMNNSNTINYSALDITGSSDSSLDTSLDTMLNSILADIDDINQEMQSDNWLDLIQI